MRGGWRGGGERGGRGGRGLAEKGGEGVVGAGATPKKHCLEVIDSVIPPMFPTWGENWYIDRHVGEHVAQKQPILLGMDVKKFTEVHNYSRAAWVGRTTKDSQLLGVHELAAWRAFYVRFTYLWKLQPTVSGGMLRCKGGRVGIGHDQEIGMCSSICKACTPLCGGATQQCNREGHMTSKFVRLYLTTGFGLCTTCARFFLQRDSTSSDTHVIAQNWNNVIKIDKHCRQQIIYIDSVLPQVQTPVMPFECRKSYEVLYERNGVYESFSNGGDEMQAYYAMIMHLNISKAEQPGENKKGQLLNKFQYCGLRLAEYHATFESFVSHLVFLFPDFTCVFKDGGRRHVGTDLLLELDGVQLSACIESKCRLGGVREPGVFHGVRRGVYPKCGGCRYKFWLGGCLLDGSVRPNEFQRMIGKIRDHQLAVHEVHLRRDMQLDQGKNVGGVHGRGQHGGRGAAVQLQQQRESGERRDRGPTNRGTGGRGRWGGHPELHGGGGGGASRGKHGGGDESGARPSGGVDPSERGEVSGGPGSAVREGLHERDGGGGGGRLHSQERPCFSDVLQQKDLAKPHPLRRGGLQGALGEMILDQLVQQDSQREQQREAGGCGIQEVRRSLSEEMGKAREVVDQEEVIEVVVEQEEVEKQGVQPVEAGGDCNQERTTDAVRTLGQPEPGKKRLDPSLVVPSPLPTPPDSPVEHEEEHKSAGGENPNALPDVDKLVKGGEINPVESSEDSDNP
eukprot:CAMPEP_0181319782 /NCGR_PEP_ID=MMETSP1101-20121128/17761_1 /TAXON_ID=46948 /ORGANISM="Rhodomonas abbreviata, Strain Caron Lab Isolate" /LENGTH=734 /DNA_ID=CAMNT_0023427417 /DNA_START=971 /DNA_END=3172 /DNA_ORIENTATION=+